jgi:hypothetical protein
MSSVHASTWRRWALLPAALLYSARCCGVAVAGATAEDSAAAFNFTELDCGVRRQILARAQQLQPWRPSFRDIFDALELAVLCGDAPPRQLVSGRALNNDGGGKAARAPLGRPSVGFPLDTATSSSSSAVQTAWFVSAGASGDDRAGDGTATRPFATVGAALDAVRRARMVMRQQSPQSPQGNHTIVLDAGVHFLNATLVLGPADSGTSISAAAGVEAWLSGGALIPVGAAWQRSGRAALAGGGDAEVWVLDLPHLDDVPGLFSLSTPSSSSPPLSSSARNNNGDADVDFHRRFTRARFPNGDAELTQWGYASYGRYNFSVPAGAVAEWHKPPAGGAQPTYTFTDLSVPGNPSGAVKNDSSMPDYNTYGAGAGGVCATVWDPTAESYWCGNNSAGGWAEVDREAAAAGQLGIPQGVTFLPNYTEAFNCTFADASAGCTSQALGPRAALWSDPAGAVVHAWHSQSWAMHMFEVQGFAAAASSGNMDDGNGDHGVNRSSLVFARGGWQGGRSWCRCDQCGYAGKFCGQHQTPPVPDTRLIGGDLFVENIREELDSPGEFFFNRTEHRLYFM